MYKYASVVCKLANNICSTFINGNLIIIIINPPVVPQVQATNSCNSIAIKQITWKILDDNNKMQKNTDMFLNMRNVGKVE